MARSIDKTKLHNQNIKFLEIVTMATILQFEKLRQY